jgi:hypothetical protein
MPSGWRRSTRAVLFEPTAPGSSSNYTAGGVMVYETFGDGTQTSYAQLGSSTSPICSGCDVANTQFDTNLTAKSSATVLLQFGADDIDFGDWVQRCYTTINCGSSDQTTLNSMLSSEETDLRTALTELNRRAGADGYSSSHRLKVVVVGYYNPYASTFDSSCVDVGNGLSYPGITSAQQTFIVNGLGSLNTNISNEVSYAQTNDGNLNPTYVDLSSVMSGHEFCTSDPWVYGPSIDYPNWQGVIPAVPDYPAPFHPTPEGQNAIYKAVVQQAGI